MRATKDRRISRRLNLWIPLEARAGERSRVAIARNVSLTGMLVASPAAFRPGESLEVHFLLPDTDQRYAVRARVVRVPGDSSEPADSLWQNHAALRFEGLDGETARALQLYLSQPPSDLLN